MFYVDPDVQNMKLCCIIEFLIIKFVHTLKLTEPILP